MKPFGKRGESQGLDVPVDRNSRSGLNPAISPGVQESGKEKFYCLCQYGPPKSATERGHGKARKPCRTNDSRRRRTPIPSLTERQGNLTINQQHRDRADA